MRWTTRVLSCAPEGDRYVVELKESHFHPRGGGQPADRGTVGGAELLDVRAKKHYLASPVEGEVECERDDDFHKRLCVMHSAEHLFMGYLARKKGFEPVKIAIGKTTGKVVFEGEVSWDELVEAETFVNRTIADAIDVEAIDVKKSEVGQDVRIKRDRVPEKVTIVCVGDFEKAACSGTHVSNTSEIGFFKVLWVNRQGKRVTVEFTAGDSAFKKARELANYALSASFALGTEPYKLEATVKNQGEMISYYSDSIRKLGRDYASHIVLKPREVRGAVMVLEALPVDKDELGKIFRKLEGEALLVSTLDGFFIARGGTAKKLAKELVEKCGGGCGGKDVVSGAVSEAKEVEKIISSFSS